MRTSLPCVWVMTLLGGCGASQDELKVMAHPQAAESCAAVAGEYKAVFTLEATDGTCEGAKDESHDPLHFDEEGNFVPPLDGLIECETLQDGCALAVRCASDGLLGAAARLDAIVAHDGSMFSGESVVSGSYEGCTRVEYGVTAVREDLPATVSY